MKVSEMIGSNIKKLMDEYTLSIRKMAEIINVTHPTVSKYLTGEQTIDSEKLMLIANYFEKDFDYFFTNDHKNLPIMFRADKPNEKINDNNYKYILNRIEEYNSVIDDKMVFVPQKYSLKVSNKLSKEDEAAIEKIALEQRRLLNIENYIPNNYFNVISESGINILCYEIDNDSLFGASSYSENLGSYIYVNSNRDISQEKQEFSLLHELGHLLFHRNEYLNPQYNPYYSTTRGDIREKIADTFAGYFLLPRDLVFNYIKEREARNEEVSPMQMKKYFRVSIQSLFVMLYKYEIINRETYNDFWRTINSKGLAKKEPNPLEHLTFEEANKKLSKRIEKLYLDDEISINKIADVLDKDNMEARLFVKNWSKKNEEFRISL